MRTLLVVVGALAMGCRSEAGATTQAARTQAKTARTTTPAPGEWSCGAVHGAARIERALGHDGRLVLGAVADTNGTTPTTMANLERLGGVFAGEHVDAVLALGDLGRNEGEIAAVLTALGQRAHAPVLALAGERAPENAFHEAVKRVHAAGVDVVDLVDTRLVDTGKIDILSVPGYPFSSKGCHYVAADLDGAARLAASAGKPIVLAAHTPPKGHGAGAIDWAIGDVHAGDEAMAALVERLHPAAALFAHVDEAGGRADGEHVNVGAIERGMGVIVEVDGNRATHRVVRP